MINADYILLIFIGLYIFEYVFSLVLEYLNNASVKRNSGRAPEPLAGLVDREQLKQAEDYTLENSRFGMISGTFFDGLIIAMIISGLLPAADRAILSGDSYPVLSGLGFFGIIGLCLYVANLPFDYYSMFHIEEKYGFNRSTRSTWVFDQLKGGLLSIVLMGILLAPILWVIDVFPKTWWILGFAVFSLIQVFLMAIYPTVVAPLFNKFTPLEEGALKDAIRRIADRAGIPLAGIFQMDAERRTGHTNAYFSGLGRTKRIVLYDTLINTHPVNEIASVLAHEIGHLKGKHILKQFVLFEGIALGGFYLTSLVLNWDALYDAFGFDPEHYYAGLFIIAIAGQKLMAFLNPPVMAVTRRYERAADSYAAVLMGSADGLVGALKRMSIDNRMNLHPHPLYVMFHYSHPTISDRIASLERIDSKKNQYGNEEADG